MRKIISITALVLTLLLSACSLRLTTTAPTKAHKNPTTDIKRTTSNKKDDSVSTKTSEKETTKKSGSDTTKTTKSTTVTISIDDTGEYTSIDLPYIE